VPRCRCLSWRLEDASAKATGEAVDVNTFDVISSEKKQCVVRWGRILSSVCGFTKIVTLNFTDNKWVVVGVKLETVS